MIIIKLYGGLGNQLFQWAFGKALSNKQGTNVKFDTSSYLSDDLRNFELSNLIGDVQIASDREIKESRKENNPAALLNRKVRSAVLPYYKRDIVCEKTYLFDEELLEKANPKGYFDGYWQNAHYFESMSPEILKMIRFPSSHNKIFLDLRKEFQRNDITSIHVRRGDYANHPELLKIHGLCSAEYYSKAISIIQEKQPNSTFYVFSDDIDWCKLNLTSSADLKYIDGTETMYEDLELLTLASNNITANSSFSWWGAWLNQNESKTIISPIKWFDQATIDFSEIVPKSWIKI
ncbi:MAG: hypothetical protein ACI857_000105 [Arenicella sp.]|jgi:hypothetical protein